MQLRKGVLGGLVNGWAYIRGGGAGDVISGIKKKRFRYEPQQCCWKYVFNLLIFN